MQPATACPIPWRTAPRAPTELPALPTPDPPCDRLSDPVAPGPVEEGDRLPEGLALRAQIGVERRRLHDLAGVHEAPRVEPRLGLPIRVPDRPPFHLLEELAARKTTPVLARERAPMCEYELGHLLGESAQNRRA